VTLIETKAAGAAHQAGIHLHAAELFSQPNHRQHHAVATSGLCDSIYLSPPSTSRCRPSPRLLKFFVQYLAVCPIVLSVFLPLGAFHCVLLSLSEAGRTEDRSFLSLSFHSLSSLFPF
jgi:hypothetical protein